MTDPADPLERLVAALRRLRRHRLLQNLQPGITAAEVRALLDSVGLTSSSGLEALYSWRDGTSTRGVTNLDDIQMFPGFYLLSLDDAVANYRAFLADRRWHSGWLPLFANGGGDFYVVALGSPTGCPVRHFRIDESDHPVEFGSIQDMLRTLAEAFDRGVFFVHPAGYLEMDDHAFAAIAAELNPQVAWWTSE